MKSCIKTVYVISENFYHFYLGSKARQTKDVDKISRTIEAEPYAYFLYDGLVRMVYVYVRVKNADQTIFNVGVSFCANFCKDFLEIRTKGNTLTLKIV